MDLLNVIIIDDEKSAREATSLMIQTFSPELKIVGEFNGVDPAVYFLNNNAVNLIFLDIEMPKKNGFELFNSVDCSNYQVIMVTGYNQYAVQAFKNAACHYLLKPLVPEELIKAVSIAKQRSSLGTSIEQLNYLKNAIAQKEKYPKTIVVHIKNGFEIISVNTIVRFEGDRNYTWVHTNGNSFLTAKTLKEFEDILNPSQFYRIHQSHLVNRSFLKKITNKGGNSNMLLTNGDQLSVSRHRKRDFINWLEQRN